MPTTDLFLDSSPLTTLKDWLAGDGKYETLVHCMGHDYPWIIITVVLDLLVVIGYAAIMYHWNWNQSHIPPSPAKRALGRMRNIFFFCGICGYLFIPIKMFWPAWRLYDLFLVFLNLYTWLYVFNSRDLRVVYSRVARTEGLERDLNMMQHGVDTADLQLVHQVLDKIRRRHEQVKQEMMIPPSSSSLTQRSHPDGG